ncbi:MAG: hypothetical protein JRC99_04375 [Deltaproteobacteria bacterium]|nr:hypothetical protein [Deltaproteobacteria bacterium]
MGTNLDEGVSLLQDLSKEELIAIIVDDSKNWLAHDGQRRVDCNYRR